MATAPDVTKHAVTKECVCCYECHEYPSFQHQYDHFPSLACTSQHSHRPVCLQCLRQVIEFTVPGVSPKCPWCRAEISRGELSVIMKGHEVRVPSASMYPGPRNILFLKAKYRSHMYLHISMFYFTATTVKFLSWPLAALCVFACLEILHLQLINSIVDKNVFHVATVFYWFDLYIQIPARDLLLRGLTPWQVHGPPTFVGDIRPPTLVTWTLVAWLAWFSASCFLVCFWLPPPSLRGGAYQASLGLIWLGKLYILAVILIYPAVKTVRILTGSAQQTAPVGSQPEHLS